MAKPAIGIGKRWVKDAIRAGLDPTLLVMPDGRCWWQCAMPDTLIGLGCRPSPPPTAPRGEIVIELCRRGRVDYWHGRFGFAQCLPTGPG